MRAEGFRFWKLGRHLTVWLDAAETKISTLGNRDGILYEKVSSVGRGVGRMSIFLASKFKNSFPGGGM